MASPDSPGQPGDERDPAGADRVTALERRARWLLRAYPAAYRRDRGEEIIGTLLEATPDGRAWPRKRDARALVFGGMKARAARNRRFTPGANLNVGVLVGLAIYLSDLGAGSLAGGLIWPRPDLASDWAAWLLAATGLFTVATVLLAWTAPRIFAAGTGLVAAAAVVLHLVIVHPEAPHAPALFLLVPAVTQVTYLATLVALMPRAARPSRRWLWLVAAFAVTALVSSLVPPLMSLGEGMGWLWPVGQEFLPTGLVIAVGLVSIVWSAIDARLAVAVTTYFTLLIVRSQGSSIIAGPGLNALLLLLFIAAVTALVSWLLWRQSGRSVAIDGK
jgi:hypothetical protein